MLLAAELKMRVGENWLMAYVENRLWVKFASFLAIMRPLLFLRFVSKFSSQVSL